MKKFVFVFVVLISLSGCTSITYPALSDKAFPTRHNFEILGEIVIEGTCFSIDGLITWGGIKYMDLLGKARRQYGKVDDVVSISLDKKFFWFLIIFREDITMRGIAIRYIEPTE